MLFNAVVDVGPRKGFSEQLRTHLSADNCDSFTIYRYVQAHNFISNSDLAKRTCRICLTLQSLFVEITERAI